MIEGKEILVSRGAVATEPKTAARIGAAIMNSGGNAMDAAAASCLASSVLAPEPVDVGGYLFCALVLEGGSGQVWCVDANSVAPAAANARMYDTRELEGNVPAKPGINENEYACSVRDNANIHGPLAIGPPGVVAGIGLLWERWGRLKWSEIVEPSLHLLADGFRYGSTARAIKNKEAVIRRYEPTVRHLMPKTTTPNYDDVWFRPDLAKTLERLAYAGWQDFYQGELGRRIGSYVTSIGGILTVGDMAEFYPRVTKPYVTTYHGAQVHGATLPSGGLSSLQILNMLDTFDPIPTGSAAHWHRLAELLKLAWRDRLHFMGDPEFVDVPVERLLSKEYAAVQTESLRQFPDQVDRVHWPSRSSSGGTVHVSASDCTGNLVAATLSQGGFGSCVTVPDTGIILGAGMCRFDPRPGHANSIAPRKRPLNNAAPTILRVPERDVAMGLSGGRRIVSVSAQLCQQVVDWGATGLAAITAPRMHVEAAEPIRLSKSTQPPIFRALVAMGHTVIVSNRVGGAAHTVEFFKKSSAIRAGGDRWTAGF
jgi:gamma-glutamyltranspeptidase/glutathione hydrolase